MPDLHVLETVWGDREGYVFVPRWLITGYKANGKPQGSWDEGRAFKWPSEKEAIFNRIKSGVEEGYETYFCPVVFDKPRRTSKDSVTGEYTGPKKIGTLWADLDDVDPNEVSPRPSVAWQTSEGRYAALWYLDDDYDGQTVEEANRRLTYTLGADSSGWDVGQVLRVPGTPNRKRQGRIDQGKLLWAEEHRLSIEATQTASKNDLADDSPEGRLKQIERLIEGRSLSPRTLKLLLTHPDAVIEGHRSERLWELEKLLIEDGVAISLAVQLVQLSAWNKFRGRPSEQAQIMRDLLKAEAEIREREAKGAIEPVAVLPDDEIAAGADEDVDWLTPYGKFLEQKLDPPGWIIEDIWQEGYGIIAGEPKTYKSITATDLGLSVASGLPFLGKFRVPVVGPVIMIQEENGEATVQDRIIRISRQKGLLDEFNEYNLPKNIDFYVANNFGVNLTDPAWRARLEGTLAKIKPVLLILDPLYMMIGGADENSSSEMNSILTWLTSLRNRYGCYSIVVHHYNKGQHSQRGGQKIRGSSAFHGWIENGLYLSLGSELGQVNLGREFRSMSPLPDLQIKYELASGDWSYSPYVIDEHKPQTVSRKKDEILTVLASKETRFEELRSALNTDRPKLRQWLRELQAEGLVDSRRTNQGIVYFITDEGRR